MDTDPLRRLPTRHEIGREIMAAVRRARRLRSLYKFLLKVEQDHEDNPSDSDSKERSDG